MVWERRAMLQDARLKFDVPYGMDPELGIHSATFTDPWGATIRLTQGLGKIAGVASFNYKDKYLSDVAK